MNTVGSTNESCRNAWVERTLRDLPAGLRILDAGAGEQCYRGHCRHLDYVSQDIAQYTGKGDAAGLQTGNWDFKKLDIVSDIVSIPRPDSSFDVVLCTEVFEHIVNPVLAIREFSRLMRPGGQLIITAPFCSLTHFSPYHYATGFSRYFYEYHLPLHGFEITEMTPNGSYFEYVAQEIRRIPEVAQKYANSTGRMSIVQRIARKLMLQLLGQLAAKDTGSSELLAFGFHVRAKKTLMPQLAESAR